ncbi:hypothetical protein [Bosea sp. LC85]|uniref:hypothetical protein n=1 Tax=Bosea sp. LC85 TaxID=1502851 RepID=UPI0005BCADC4|nr:hypothetical protein [Bosea sp. LC85]
MTWFLDARSNWMSDEDRPIVAMARDHEVQDVSVIPDQVDRKGELHRVYPAQVRDKMPGTYAPRIQ